MENSNENVQQLQLGDIVRLYFDHETDETTELYYIQYIDETVIVGINLNTEDEIVLEVENEEIVSQLNINKIDVVYRNEKKGYLKQNNLNIGKWISIYFEREIPIVITGKIVDVEEDKMTVETFPEKEFIHLDFEYKGIHKNYNKYNIKEIVFTDDKSRTAITEINKDNDIKLTENNNEKNNKITENENKNKNKIENKKNDNISFNELKLIENRSWGNIMEEEDEQKKNNEDEQKYDDDDSEEDTQDDNDNDFDEEMYKEGNILDDIIDEVELDDSEKYYGIDIQIHDLINDLISRIPNKYRTEEVLKSIDKTVLRFKELRHKYSYINNFNMVTKVNKLSQNMNPMSRYFGNNTTLENMKDIPYWIRMKHKILEVTNEDDEDDNEMNQTMNQNKDMITIDPDDYLLNYNRLVPSNNEDIMYIYDANNSKTPTKCAHESIVDTNPAYLSNVLSSEKMYVSSYVLLNSKYKTKSNIFNPYENILNVQYYNVFNEYINGYCHSINNVQETDITDIEPINDKEKPNLCLETMNRPVQYTMTYTDSEESDESEKNRIVEYKKRLLSSSLELYEQLKLCDSEKLNESYTLNSMISKLNIYGYDDDYIHYNMFIDMYKDIENSIKFYINTLKNSKREYVKLKKREIYKDMDIPEFMSMISTKDSDVNELYDITSAPDNYVSIYEYFIKGIKYDNGMLMMDSISRINTNLLTETNVNFILEQKLKTLENESGKTSKSKDGSNVCKDKKNLVIVKDYLNEDELKKDDNKVIYVDAKYDETNYDLIEQYKDKENGMTSEEFREFLMEKVKRNMKSSSNQEVNVEVDALLNKKREVQDGEYAKIFDAETDISIYFVRENNKWARDNTKNEEDFKHKLCLIESEEMCIPEEQNCVSSNDLRKELEKKMTKDIVDLIVKDEETSKEEIKRNIETAYAISKQKLYYKRNQFIQGVEFKPKIHTIENIRDTNGKVSKYSNLFDRILSYEVFHKKMELLGVFITMYTRPAIETEDENWYYCRESNLKLVPSFFATMVKAYFVTPDEFNIIVQQICDKRGVKSEDGDKWIDKYSGRTIRNIDFVDEYVYTEENENTDGIETNINNINSTTKLAKTDIFQIRKLVSLFERAYRVKLDNTYKTNLMMILQSYYLKNYYNLPVVNKSKMLILTCGVLYVFFIQVHVPSIKTKHVYPNCKFSISGFPVDGDANDALEYAACIIKKTGRESKKDKNSIWFHVAKMKEESMIEVMRKVYTNLSKEYEYDFNDLITKKKTFQETVIDNNRNEYDVLDNNDLNKWHYFLPVRTDEKQKHKRYELPDDSFYDVLQTNIAQERKEQQLKMDILKVKYAEMTIHLQEEVQKYVDKVSLILKKSNDEHAYSNACCQSEIEDSMNYFAKKIPSIVGMSNEVYKITSELSKVYQQSQIPRLISNVDTRIKIEIIEPNIHSLDEQSLYKIYWSICKKLNFNNSLCRLFTESTELEENEITKMDVEKIDVNYLKNKGVTITSKSLEELILNVQSKNIRKNIIEKDEVKIKKDSKIELLKQLYQIYDKQRTLNIQTPIKRDELIMKESVVDQVYTKFKRLFKNVDEEEDKDKDKNENEDNTNLNINEEEENKNEMLQDNSMKHEEYLLKNIVSYDVIKHLIVCLSINTKYNKSKLKDKTPSSEGEVSKQSRVMYNVIMSEMLKKENKIKIFLNEYANVPNSQYSKPVILNFLKNMDEMIDSNNVVKKCDYIKECIWLFTCVYPTYILNEKDYTHYTLDTMKIPEHWDLSTIHERSVKNEQMKLYNILNKYKENRKLKEVIRINVEWLRKLRVLSVLVPSIQKEHNLDDCFENNMIILIFQKWLFVTAVELYTNIEQSLADIIRLSDNNEQANQYDYDFEIKEDDEEIIIGDIDEYKRGIGHYIYSCLEIFMNNKKTINFNKDSLKTKMIQYRQDERDIKTRRLEDMTQEQRDVDTLLKKHKIGDEYNHIYQKGLTRYDKEYYDREIENIKQNIERELKDKKISDSTVAYSDILYMDEMQNQIRDYAIEREELDMNFIGDDDEINEYEY